MVRAKKSSNDTTANLGFEAKHVELEAQQAEGGPGDEVLVYEATDGTLREHLVRGYTLNRQRLEQNARELESALALVRKAAAGEALTGDQGRGPGGHHREVHANIPAAAAL